MFYGIDRHPLSGLDAAFVLLSAAVNFFMESASTKWAILSPIFESILMTVNMSLPPRRCSAASGNRAPKPSRP